MTGLASGLGELVWGQWGLTIRALMMVRSAAFCDGWSQYVMCSDLSTVWGGKGGYISSTDTVPQVVWATLLQTIP